MHKGIVAMATAEGKEERYTLKGFLTDLLFSFIHTGIIAVIIYAGILRFPTEYCVAG
jgi:hypothetical protein